MVTFIVGIKPQQETFQVHKEHACHYSPVLDKAFNSLFLEGKTQTYIMPEEHPGAFRHFVQWLYTQKFNPLITESKVSSAKTAEEITTLVDRFAIQTTELLNLWILGQTLQIPSLQNMVMDALVLSGPPSAALLGSLSSDIYERSGSTCPLRGFVAQICAWSMESGDIDGLADDFDKSFLVDIFKVLRTAAPDSTVDKNKRNLASEDFHVKGP